LFDCSRFVILFSIHAVDSKEGDSAISSSEIYPKAHTLNRFVAKLLDVVIAGAASQLLPPVGWVAGLSYVLIADGFVGGSSLGKRLIGLQTMVHGTHACVGFKESILRNLPLAIAYAVFWVPYVGWLLSVGLIVIESLLMIGNEQGLRLGDHVAQTQVLDAGQLVSVD
jgi:hypothetical protein